MTNGDFFLTKNSSVPDFFLGAKALPAPQELTNIKKLITRNISLILFISGFIFTKKFCHNHDYYTQRYKNVGNIKNKPMKAINVKIYKIRDC